MKGIKKRRRWPLALLVPVGAIGAIVAVPALLFAMLLGSRVLSLIAGPVNIWNMPWKNPRAADLAGWYVAVNVPDGLSRGAAISAHSGLRLGHNHELEMIDMPVFDGSGELENCRYNGTGHWASSADSGVTITFDIEASIPPKSGDQPSCAPVALLGVFELLGHSHHTVFGTTSEIQMRTAGYYTSAKARNLTEAAIGQLHFLWYIVLSNAPNAG